MIREEAKANIESFIKDKLLRNENDEYLDSCIKLYTKRGREFIIYKKNFENSIFVKPREGNKHFSESIDRILDYFIDNRTDHHSDKSYVVPISNYIFQDYKNQNTPIVVLTHNPKGKWGDVRPQIEQGAYKNWGKGGMSFELGQQVLIYISKGANQINYIMEVNNIHTDSIDLKLVRKLSESESQLLSFEHLKQNGLKVGTVNYILDNNKSLYKYVMNILNNNFEREVVENKSNTIKTKNIILYGAPGVGKTHNYQKLISMIENGYDESEIFHSITDNKTSEKVELNEALFQEIKDEKRVEFVTFHQNYSYEDFIEGFRPNKDGDIELDKYGVFKAISEKARINLEESKKDYQEISQEVTFKQKIEKFIEDLETKIESDGYYSITDSAYITSIDSDAFRYNIRREKPTYKYDLRMKFEDLYEFEKNNVQSRQDVKKLETINSLANQHASYYFNVFKEINVQNINQNISNNEIKKEEQKNFYIVIDEVNRGNISKIFGELITLLEESKRDNYEVTLPYSKEKFKVPSNLYIIATMNSTDKSIATIDIALRRRFTFLKMKPNSNLVKNQEAKELMEKLNIYIKKELGEDYMLGHSYFMDDDIDLEFIKEYKIKPLLEEYFYSDEKTADEIIQEALR